MLGNNLANVSLPALVLLGEGVPLKQNTLLGEAPANCLIQNSCYGYCGGVLLLRDGSRCRGVSVPLMLRDGSQQGTGVR